ncbi:MAG TPA: hypothetical protein DCW90_01380 [Lachnospiraceae bacterium]|nr:hypothetical protein [Lachnospiraceae bacterium]
MKKGLTQMVFVLDMSGSMSSLREDTIGGYNSMIADQKKEAGDAIVTTVLFDHRYIMLHDGVNIQDIKEMTEKEYSPRGTTAMLDAVGRTINHVGQKLAELSEEERPEKVVFTIVTDGAENSSIEFTWKAIKDMIKHQREKYNWVFTFLGANIDTMEVSDNLGINRMMSKTYTASKVGTQKVFSAVSKSMSYARDVSLDELNKDAAVQDMSAILDEVEDKN